MGGVTHVLGVEDFALHDNRVLEAVLLVHHVEGRFRAHESTSERHNVLRPS